MNEGWDVSLTKSLISKAFGENASKKANLSIQSFLQRFEHAQFHYLEILSIKKKFIDDIASRSQFLIFETDERKRDAFEEFVVKIEAHTIACIQSLHSIPDISACAAYYATGQSIGSRALKEERDIKLHSVRMIIEKDERFISIANQLQLMKKIATWKSLDTLCNLAKHQSIVRVGLNEDFTGERAKKYELRFIADPRVSTISSQFDVEEFLKITYNNLNKLAIDMGVALLRLLSV